MKIRHVIKLANLLLTLEEEKKYSQQLSKILDYIKELNSVDTSGVEPLYQITGLVDSFRTDEPRGEFKMDESLNEKLVGQAPHKEGRFVKVKAVLLHK